MNALEKIRELSLEARAASANQDPVPVRAANSTEERALEMLGSGYPASIVAATLGISESRVSQLLSDDNFRAQVTERKFQNLQAHNVRDSKADKLEDRLLDKLSTAIEFENNPNRLASIYARVNAAKRRGSAAPENHAEQQVVVNLKMPVIIQQRFAISENNQVAAVIGTGGEVRSLVTMQSGSALSLARKQEETAAIEMASAAGTRIPMTLNAVPTDPRDIK